MNLGGKIFTIDAPVNFDKFSAPNGCDFKIRSFAYDCEGHKLSADVLFILSDATYAERIEIDYDGNTAFDDLITELVVAYKEGISVKQ